MHSVSKKAVLKISQLKRMVAGMIIIMLALPVFAQGDTSEATHQSKASGVAAMLDLVAPVASISSDEDSVASAEHRPVRPVRPTRRGASPITQLPDSFAANLPEGIDPMVVLDSVSLDGDSLAIVPVGEVGVDVEKRYSFNPDPTRAVWMSALFPGLGQLYNRRYWKLPIVVGAFMGLGYATNWNNTMLRDYTRAYSDIMDNDPSTKSYMDFFAPTVKEDDLDKSWLTDLLRRRKNFYRRNRDLCIICMVGVYALAIIDAYVDASLSHFDISPDLSMDISPTLIPNDTRRNGLPGIGVYWAFNF